MKNNNRDNSFRSASYNSPHAMATGYDDHTMPVRRKKSFKRVMIRTLVYLLIALIGFGGGVVHYLFGITNSFVFVNTPFVNSEDYQPVDLDALDDFDMSGDTSSSWADGGHTKVYVNPDFPIRRVEQKDSNVENILVFGVDSRGTNDIQCRADAMIIISINKNTGSVKLISLMRDMGVRIEGRSALDKLNHSYTYGGVGLLINTINDNLGLDIQRFVMLDFNSSSNIIDQLGGIEIEVASAEVRYANRSINEQNRLTGSNDPLLTHAGYQTLTGTQAVAWSRIRALDSDFVRTSRQRTLAQAMMGKVASYGRLRQLSLVEDLAGMFQTNMTSFDLIRVGSAALDSLDNLSEYRVPDDRMYTVQSNPWMMIVDFDKQIAALHEFIWGG